MPRLAKAALAAGVLEKAASYARELVDSAKSPKDWNYGNALHDGNMVLGVVSLRNGDVEQARKYLIESGKTPGSPQLGSFGPNMTLAKEMIEKGEKDTVLEYFSLCRSFWKMDAGRLNEWSATIRAGNIPSFGANLAPPLRSSAIGGACSTQPDAMDLLRIGLVCYTFAQIRCRRSPSRSPNCCIN